jgi:hypothetical protein
MGWRRRCVHGGEAPGVTVFDWRANMASKNTVCIWYDDPKNGEPAA